MSLRDVFLNLRVNLAEQDRWREKVATVVLLATVFPFTIVLRVRDQWRLNRRIRVRRMMSMRKVDREESSLGGSCRRLCLRGWHLCEDRGPVKGRGAEPDDRGNTFSQLM